MPLIHSCIKRTLKTHWEKTLNFPEANIFRKKNIKYISYLNPDFFLRNTGQISQKTIYVYYHKINNQLMCFQSDLEVTSKQIYLNKKWERVVLGTELDDHIKA